MKQKLPNRNKTENVRSDISSAKKLGVMHLSTV